MTIKRQHANGVVEVVVTLDLGLKSRHSVTAMNENK